MQHSHSLDTIAHQHTLGACDLVMDDLLHTNSSLRRDGGTTLSGERTWTQLLAPTLTFSELRQRNLSGRPIIDWATSDQWYPLVVLIVTEPFAQEHKLRRRDGKTVWQCRYYGRPITISPSGPPARPS